MAEITNQVLPILILIWKDAAQPGPTAARVFLLGGGEYAQAALFALLILPPPFIIPLYMREGIVDERRYVNNMLSPYTLVSIAVFIVYLSINPL